MTAFPATTTKAPGSAPTAFVEKTPLARYVAPERPSLVGMTRAGLAQALGAIGVPERQHRMRVAQLWHWLYVRGATDFEAMTSLSKELRTELPRGTRSIGRKS